MSNEDVAAVTGREADSLAGVNGSALHPLPDLSSGLTASSTPAPTEQVTCQPGLSADRCALRPAYVRRSAYARATAQPPRPSPRNRGGAGRLPGERGRARSLRGQSSSGEGGVSAYGVPPEFRPPPVNFIAAILKVTPLLFTFLRLGICLQASPLRIFFGQPGFLSNILKSSLQPLIHLFLPVHFELIP